MKIIDISPELSSNTAVFPGDQPYVRKVSLDFSKGHNLLLSSIETSLHIGAHVDAPNHYSSKGEGIAQVSLSRYMGLVQVIEMKKARGSRIEASDIAHIEIKAPRVLFKTSSFPNPNLWNNDFVSLSASLIKDLSQRSVVLVGIDTPSVDLADDKILEAHNEIFKNKMSILEGIVLDQVSEGLYTLLAIPLKLKDADASPVRAVLIEKDLGF